MTLIVHLCETHGETGKYYADCDCGMRLKCQWQGCGNMATHTERIETEFYPEMESQ